jgi:pantoate--beta-alanine ligase
MPTAASHTSPRIVHEIAELKAAVRAARAAGRRIGVVPTMGALHEGHLSLVDAARQDCDFIVATIFVNPTQFGPGEDFSKYPRTLAKDVELLSPRGVDLVFAPEAAAMYGPEHVTKVILDGPALSLEGDFRPTHFEGVATIVLKLFNLVQPDRAYFGRKDFQQAMVVQRMVADLDVPVEVIVCPTVREADGLAMSSRNVYLSAEERQRALSLSRALSLAKQLIAGGELDVATILKRMRDVLTAADAEIDYVAICNEMTLAPLERIEGPAVALIAARIGKTRLIDNELLNAFDSPGKGPAGPGKG